MTTLPTETPFVTVLPTPNSKLALTVRDIGTEGTASRDEVIGLPDGYTFTDTSTLGPGEVGQLMQQLEMGNGYDDGYHEGRNIEMGFIGLDVLDVGVRDQKGKLVGFGSIVYKDNSGEMGDFMVSPEHQHQGIGKANIDERLRKAEAAGITTLSTHNLEPTNTLKPFYLERGFVETKPGTLVRGDNPISVNEVRRNRQLLMLARIGIDADPLLQTTPHE